MSEAIEFNWDGANLDHVAAHGIAPEEVEEAMLNGPLFLKTEVRNGEERSTYLGAAGSGSVLIVVVTPRTGLVRVVTAWRAKKRWRDLWIRQTMPPTSS